MTVDLFKYYLDFCRGTETPPLFHRWSFISALGAVAGKRVWIKFGSKNIYPNCYVLLLGNPGTKKSTAIKLAKKVLMATGYDTFSAEKTSKEKYLTDLAGVDEDGSAGGSKDFLELPFAAERDVVENYIVIDEFNDFFANNILDFVSTLSNLWDYEGIYKSRLKNSKSIEIPNPIINLLGGNTQETLASTFPSEAVGQGFFSRIIPVFAPPLGIRIAWPREPPAAEFEFLVKYLSDIQTKCNGEMIFTDGARKLVEESYMTWKPIADPRFTYYTNRRQPHLLKLCMIHAMARLSMEITEADVTYANTVLSHTEHFMPDSLGHFGFPKANIVQYKVEQILANHGLPVDLSELMVLASTVVKDQSELSDLVRGLIDAEKVQYNQELRKFILKKRVLDSNRFDRLIDYRKLTDLERSNV